MRQGPAPRPLGGWFHVRGPTGPGGLIAAGSCWGLLPGLEGAALSESRDLQLVDDLAHPGDALGDRDDVVRIVEVGDRAAKDNNATVGLDVERVRIVARGGISAER